MARSHGILKIEIWNADSDFRGLTRNAQWTYMMLLSQPQINNCGVLPFTPARWEKLSSDGSRRALNAALRELKETTFVLVDERTSELLLRTFVRHDKIWSQPNLVKSARKQLRAIESDDIRSYLVAKHPWLTDESVDPSQFESEPLSEPLSEPPVESRSSSPTPSPTPAPGPSPTPTVVRDETEASEARGAAETSALEMGEAEPVDLDAPAGTRST